jgi:hypothetical protein
MKLWTGFGVMQCHAIFRTRSRKRPIAPESFLIAQTTLKSRNALAIGIRFSHDSSI